METKTRKRRKAFIDKTCVACGCCLKVCPKQALEIWKGITAKVDLGKMCGMWKVCKGMSGIRHLNSGGFVMKKHWYDYLWILSLAYLILGFVNILFAWLGLLCFFIPLLIAAIGGTKGYCNRYCGRGQLFGLLGRTFWSVPQKRYPPVDEK